MSETTQELPQASTSPLDSLSDLQAPNLQATSESPTEGNLEAAPTDPETLKSERVARALASATKKERKAAERERQAANQVKQADERTKQAEQARDELTGLLLDAASNPDKALALLKKAGIPSLDHLARLIMHVEHPPEQPNVIAQRALKEAQDLREQIQQERQAVIDAKNQSQYQETYNHHINKIDTILKAAGDEFALSLDHQGQAEILQRSYAFIRQNQIETMSNDDETLLIKHFASELEAELAPQAQSLLERLTKIKKLVGITNHNDSGTIQGSPNQAVKSESLDPESLQQVASAIREKKSSKFITNENTITSKPLPKTYNLGRKDNDAITEALRAMDGK